MNDLRRHVEFPTHPMKFQVSSSCIHSQSGPFLYQRRSIIDTGALLDSITHMFCIWRFLLPASRSPLRGQTHARVGHVHTGPRSFADIAVGGHVASADRIPDVRAGPRSQLAEAIAVAIARLLRTEGLVRAVPVVLTLRGLRLPSLLTHEKHAR